MSTADLSSESSEWSDSEGEEDYDPFLGPGGGGLGLPLVLDDSKRKFSSPSASRGGTSPSMRIRKGQTQADPASCPAQLCAVRGGQEESLKGDQPGLLDQGQGEEDSEVELRPGARKKRRRARAQAINSKGLDLPSLDEIDSIDITNDETYNRILRKIAKQRKRSNAPLSRGAGQSVAPRGSHWSSAKLSASDSPRRRVQASPLGAARLASASARLCAIENAILGIKGVGHMQEFLEKKREDFLMESAKWQAQLVATQAKKTDLLEELQTRSAENSALHEELQAEGLESALTLLEQLLVNVEKVNSSVRESVEAADSSIALHYNRHADGHTAFLINDGPDISGTVGRAAAAFAQVQPSRRLMGRTSSVSVINSSSVGRLDRSGFRLDMPAASMCSTDVVKAQATATPQKIDDLIMCVLSTVEALRSTYCVGDLLKNDSKLQWFPLAEMEQTNDELESALKSLAAENSTLKTSLELSRAATSNLERMREDMSAIADCFSQMATSPASSALGVLRASRSVKVTSSLLSMQADLEAVFPNATMQDTSQIEWSNDKGAATIKNASLDSLLSIVTASCDASNAYLHSIKRTFFLTFRYYLTVPQLLEKLVLRFCMCPPQTIPSKPSCADYSGMERCRSNNQQPDRAGIMDMLHHWVAEWFDLDFRNSDKNLDILRAFLRNTAANCGSYESAEQIELLISRLLLQKSNLEASWKGEAVTAEDDGADLGSLGAEMGALEAMKISSIMDIPPGNLAEQLTLLESKQYGLIKPCELLCQAWSKKDKEKKSPNLHRTFQHFNSVSALFVSAILAEADVQVRAGVVRHILVVGMHFLRLRNYNGVMEVVSALQSSSVERLWLTWNHLGKHLYAAKQLLCTITKNNMQAFRHLWKEASFPALPYVGVFLTDLTFLEDGNPTWADGSCTLVNMFKFRMIEHTISVLLAGQTEAGFDMEEDPAVQAYFSDLFKSALSVDEDSWYRMSLSLETREAAKKARHFAVKYEFETLQEAVNALVSLRTHPLLNGEGITLAEGDELAGQAHISTRQNSEQRLRSNALMEVKFTPLELDNIASRMRATTGGVLRKDRRFRMKVYAQAFLGNDAVDWLVSHESKLNSRAAAVKFGKMLVKLHYVRHVTNDHSFKDKPHIYQFVENFSRPGIAVSTPPQ